MKESGRPNRFDFEKIVKRYNQIIDIVWKNERRKVTMREVCEILGCSHMTVYRAIRSQDNLTEGCGE